MRRTRTLVVEDQQIVRDLLVAVLDGAGHEVRAAETGEAGLAALAGEIFDLVLLDLHLPGISGMEVLASARPLQTDAQFIVMTGVGTVESAVEAMRLGAYHYLNKPVDTDELLLTADRALREAELRREVARLRRQSGEGAARGLVGRSAAMRRVLDLIERVAPQRATVLITGETGTGKERVAQAVHALSDRARRPFVAVNCSELPETLLESELFGHVKGAFTGASANRRGLFEEAEGGTLFLDEVGTLSHAVQVKLLRVLQERRVRRLGSGQALDVDFRLVAAANVDLAEEVRGGRFREDLYYRLSVFPIHVPPLRERRDDIPLLAQHFRQRIAQETGVEPPAVDAETLRRMMAYDWPGNVRELEHFMERASIMHAGSPSIAFTAPAGRGATPESTLLSRAAEERWPLARVEREHISEILRSVGGHQVRAADALGIDRRTLQRKLKQFREEGHPVG